MAKQEYIERNRQWLKDKAAEPGVIALDKGILYKVIKSGNAKGPKPNRNSVVVVHYTGRTINGKTFPDFIIGTPNLVRGLKVGVVHHE